MSKASAIDFANEVPTTKEPSNPGPFVKAIASMSSMEIPAFLLHRPQRVRYSANEHDSQALEQHPHMIHEPSVQQ